MGEPFLINPELWASSRAGARAGRGFRFQDAAAAWLATRIWAGEIDATTLVAEGVDDITLHGGAAEIRVQAKSRHDPRGLFATAELADVIIKSASTIDAQSLKDGSARIVVLLERLPVELDLTDWEGRLVDSPDNADFLVPYLGAFLDERNLTMHTLLSATTIVTMPDPLDAATVLLAARRQFPDAVARLIAHRLRFEAGQAADHNFRRPAEHPATIGAGDVEAIAAAVQALIDPETLFPAIAQGLCEHVSFVPVEAPHFFEGIDVVPGHVAAGLVFERADLLTEIAAGLQRQRIALIAGPSGSGKSGAAWLFAYENRHAIRWYRIKRGAVDEAHLLVQLARSLEASPERPVGFVLDDLGRDLNGIWDALAAELRHEPGVLMLGTTREEDLFLVGNLASTALVRPVLDAGLAERIWTALAAEGDVAFVHWREPFELSQGLLLEYGHLLTRGQRLQDTIEAQVRQRLREGRDDELAILQAVIPAARCNGASDAARLRARLDLSGGAFDRALARLVDEHALRVAADGSLIGLHQIRSAGLYRALANQLPRPVANELAELAYVLCASDFARVIPLLLREMEGIDEPLLDALAGRFPYLSLRARAAVFHGLGVAVCDRIATVWTEIIKEGDIEPRHATLIFNLALADVQFDIPTFARVNAASARIHEAEQVDLRAALLSKVAPLPVEIEGDLDDYHELLASLVPIKLMKPAPSVASLPRGDFNSAPLDQLLGVAATIREFGEPQARALVTLFGGTNHLLDRIHKEKAWVTKPQLRKEDGALVVASDVRFMGDAVQPNGNDVVVEHCERLLAAAPHAEIAASTLLFWDGSPAGFAGHRIAEKRIPRDNLPVPVRVAWNRAMLRAIQGRNGPTTESGRANALAVAVRELSTMLPEAVEFYCRGVPADDHFRKLLAVRGLLNSFIDPPSIDRSTQSARDQGQLEIADRVYDFVNAVLTLANELVEGIRQPLKTSAEAAKLRAEADALLDADSWRWLDAPPAAELTALSATLNDLDAVLGDAHAHPDAFRRSRLLAEKTSRNRRALTRFASDARSRADKAVETIAESIRAALDAAGIEAVIASRPMDDTAAHYWPRVDFAVLMPVSHLLDFMTIAETFTNVVKELPNHRTITIVPVREGLVVGALAGVVLDRFLPAIGFVEKWQDHLPAPLVEERSAALLAQFGDAVMQISAIPATIDRDLNAEELAYAQTLIARVKEKFDAFLRLRETENDPDIEQTCIFMMGIVERLQAEFADSGTSAISVEFAKMVGGTQTEFTNEFIGYRIGLLERDILKAAGKPSRPVQV